MQPQIQATGARKQAKNATLQCRGQQVLETKMQDIHRIGFAPSRFAKSIAIISERARNDCNYVKSQSQEQLQK